MKLKDDINEVWRYTDNYDNLENFDGKWLHVSEGVFEILEALGLSKAKEKPAKGKVGRLRTRPLPDPNAPKKKRGRPKKESISLGTIVQN